MKLFKTLLVFVLFMGVLPQAAMAQQSIFDRNSIVSPRINEDGTVTFSLYAPECRSRVTASLLIPFV